MTDTRPGTREPNFRRQQQQQRPRLSWPSPPLPGRAWDCDDDDEEEAWSMSPGGSSAGTTGSKKDSRGSSGGHRRWFREAEESTIFYRGQRGGGVRPTDDLACLGRLLGRSPCLMLASALTFFAAVGPEFSCKIIHGGRGVGSPKWRRALQRLGTRSGRLWKCGLSRLSLLSSHWRSPLRHPP